MTYSLDFRMQVLKSLDEGMTLNPIEKKWAQVKFLRQGWLENDLSKLFYDVCPNHNNFILN
ncbi:hypothetical protein [Psychrobacter sp. PSP]|uniref:hypothetical protein n=1 Tax=Psychrobacter sp. PSP TaxID=2734636 RepID=UPI002096497C|nr:hypothetical protein [Psychrobacter sp. PSP]